MKEKQEKKITIKKKTILWGLVFIIILAVVGAIVFLTMPALVNGVVSVRVEAGKMACKTNLPLLDNSGKPTNGAKILSGAVEQIAHSPYTDPKIVNGPPGVRYTFNSSFEEIVRKDKNTGIETVQAVTGTYRYCFITAASTTPGKYDVTVQLTFYKANSEDSPSVGAMTIPYQLEVTAPAK